MSDLSSIQQSNSSSINSDIIYALASSLQNSSICIIRVSGKNCKDLIKKCIPSKSHSKIKDNYNFYSDFFDPNSLVHIDDLMLTFF